jgi:hypothetical protein
MSAADHPSWMASTPWNQGRTRLNVALRTLDRGERTSIEPVTRELAVLVLAGRGRLVVDGASQRFSAPCSVIPPVGTEYCLVNDAAERMSLLITALQAPPVPVALARLNRQTSFALAEPP